MTTKVAFVVDTSGSMETQGRAGMAITFARSILGQEGDDLLVSMYAFKEGYAKWPGVKPDPKEARLGPPPPEGWTEFPGVPQLESAQEWLNAQGSSGGTNPIGAITAALNSSVTNLTVVLITDGEFEGTSFLAAIAACQTDRVKKKLGRAVIFIIGTGADAAKVPHLVQVAKTEGGGLHVIRRPEQQKK